MKLISVFLAAGASALLLACATMPDQASYAPSECKVVLIDSASQEIRAYNSDLHDGRYKANTSTEQAEASAAIGKQQALRPSFRMGHNEPNPIAQAQKDC